MSLVSQDARENTEFDNGDVKNVDFAVRQVELPTRCVRDRILTTKCGVSAPDIATRNTNPPQMPHGAYGGAARSSTVPRAREVVQPVREGIEHVLADHVAVNDINA